MAEIIPFKGIRYNQEKTGNMAELVTPPYDVIDGEAQEKYYQKNTYNIIRLEYGKVRPNDDLTNNRYSRAAELFKNWLDNDILQRDKEPALYLYEQEFKLDGKQVIRTGFICAVKVEPYEKGVILPHEETLPKHKEDRLKLMNACKCNFSPIFGLYSDKEMIAASLLKGEAKSKEPDAVFKDENNEIHRLWVIVNKNIIESVQNNLKHKRLFIADGHHRYETALNYKQQFDNQPRKDNNLPLHNYVMMLLVNLYDPGLIILPTHRLVKNAEADRTKSLTEKLQQDFILEEYPLEPGKKDIKDFLRDLSKFNDCDNSTSIHSNVFGIYLGNGRLIKATLRESKNLHMLMPPNKSSAWQGLDVSVLHSLIIEKHLGIGPELLAKGDHVIYTREEEGALEAVDRGDFQLAFFLNPTNIEEVTEVAENAEKMPQKSTYFYPKVISGMVINPLY